METLSRLTYEGCAAWIEIDGKELQCYSTDVDHAKKIVTCWIASEAGKTFSISCQPNNVQASHWMVAYLDGTRVKSIGCSKDTKQRRPYRIRNFSTSSTTEVPFIFSLLELTDDDNYLQTIPSSANVGEIKLVIQSISDPVWKKPRKKGISKFRQIPTTVEKVHERSKKAMAHRICFGNEQPKTHPDSTAKLVAHYDHTSTKRLVTFIFRYRPLDVLQANDIVPRIPESIVPSQSNYPSTSGQSSKRKRKATKVQESVKNFEDQENALLAKLSRLKDEKEQFLLTELEKVRKDKYSPNDNVSRKKVKRVTKPFILAGEVIDLT